MMSETRGLSQYCVTTRHERKTGSIVDRFCWRSARMLLWGLCGLAISTLSACTRTAQPPTVTLAAETVEIPLSRSGTCPGARYIVHVSINGEGPFSFLLDTGTGPFIISSHLADLLHLPRTRDPRWARGADGGRHYLGETTTLETVELGKLTVCGHKAVVADLNIFQAQPGHPQLDGIVGFSLFQDHIMVLRLSKPRMLVTRQLHGKQDGLALPLTIRDGIPEVPISIVPHSSNNHAVVTLSLDTGSNGGFTLPSGMGGQQLWTEVGDAPVQTLSGESTKALYRLRGTIVFGGVLYTEPIVALDESSPSARGGTLVLEEYNIILDPVHGRAWISQIDR